jgi:hypothetical protein
MKTSVSIAEYDSAQSPAEASVCRKLRAEIERALPNATSRVWHGSPVWFVGDIPVTGYNVPAKGGVALLFWNGQAFGDPTLKPIGKDKAAQIHYGALSEIKVTPLRQWFDPPAEGACEEASVTRDPEIRRGLVFRGGPDELEQMGTAEPPLAVHRLHGDRHCQLRGHVCGTR